MTFTISYHGKDNKFKERKNTSYEHYKHGDLIVYRKEKYTVRDIIFDETINNCQIKARACC